MDHLAAEEQHKASAGHNSSRMVDAFRNPAVWLLCVVYFGFVMGNYGLGFWLPQIISETITKIPFHIGLLSMIPWSLAAISMVVVGRHSDRTGERRWHIAIAGLSARRHSQCPRFLESPVYWDWRHSPLPPPESMLRSRPSGRCRPAFFLPPPPPPASHG